MTLYDKESPNPNILLTKRLREQQLRDLWEYCYLDRFSAHRPFIVVEINKGNHYYLNTTQHFQIGDQSLACTTFLGGLLGSLHSIGKVIERKPGYDTLDSFHQYADRYGEIKLWKPVETLPEYRIRTVHNPNASIQLFFSDTLFF